MKIKVTGLGALVKIVGQPREWEIETNMTLVMLKVKVGIQENYPVYYAVNGVLSKQDRVLHEGDEVKIMNLVSAG